MKKNNLISRDKIPNIENYIESPGEPVAILLKHGEVFSYIDFEDLTDDEYMKEYYTDLPLNIKKKLHHMGVTKLGT